MKMKKKKKKRTRFTMQAMDPRYFRRLRESLGLSQSELAALMSVQRSTVSRWEHGHRAIPGPSELLLKVLAKREHQKK